MQRCTRKCLDCSHTWRSSESPTRYLIVCPRCFGRKLHRIDRRLGSQNTVIRRRRAMDAPRGPRGRFAARKSGQR